MDLKGWNESNSYLTHGLNVCIDAVSASALPESKWEYYHHNLGHRWSITEPAEKGKCEVAWICGFGMNLSVSNLLCFNLWGAVEAKNKKREKTVVSYYRNGTDIEKVEWARLEELETGYC